MARTVNLKQFSLKETFEYVDGTLYRIVPVRGSSVGARFGSRYAGSGQRQSEYRRGRFNGRCCFEHRLVWELLNGPIPSGAEIDHIDHNGLNNKIENLRLTTTKGNGRNKPMSSTNKSGICGVHWAKTAGKWNAQAKTDGKSKNIGYFDTIFDAAAARISFGNSHGFHVNHGR